MSHKHTSKKEYWIKTSKHKSELYLVTKSNGAKIKEKVSF